MTEGGGLPQDLGCKRQGIVSRVCFLTEVGRVAWIVKFVNVGAESEAEATDVMEISRPDDLPNVADLGLTLAETKWLLAGLQHEMVAGQVRAHAVRQRTCARCGDVCHVKDYQDHASRRFSAGSRCGFPGFAVPRVAGSTLASTGHRIAGQRRSWTDCRRISVPS